MFFMTNSIVEEPGESNEDANRVVMQRRRAISVNEILR